MMKKKVEDEIIPEEFRVAELEYLGELVLDKVKDCYEKMYKDLDEVYTLDYNLMLFEKIKLKYLKKLQDAQKERREWEMERDFELAKFELKRAKLERQKGGKKWKKKLKKN